MRSVWPLRIAASKLRPWNVATATRVTIVTILFSLFLYGDLRLCSRLFHAVAQIEAASPFFAIGLLRNVLAMVFLVSTVVLFSSAMTAAIGSFFADLDLDLYHSAPRAKLGIALSRWAKTLAESAAVVFAFLVPLFFAFGRTYNVAPSFYAIVAMQLFLLFTIPVSIASSAIVLLVRLFPVRRVHQIVATIAILVLTVAVTAFRMSRPERFFTEVRTDDLVRVLRAIELPSMDLAPSTAIADYMSSSAVRARYAQRSAGVVPLPLRNESNAPALPFRIAGPALAAFAAFVVIARSAYFEAFVRARESLAPVAIGSAAVTRLLDRLLAPLDLQTRALAGKEIRILGRDVAQWSQLFLMAALLFIYLYNIRILPLSGDARATLIAYANVGMAGFVISAICLRFAYPSVSAEGKAFWLVQSAPISYRRFLLVKVFVYSAPLTILSLFLTTLANLVLGARPTVWVFTTIGSSLLAVTLVGLGVGLGALTPNFAAENPLQVGLSLGGFAYMALSLGYVATVMVLMARPVIRYFFTRVFGQGEAASVIGIALPIAGSVVLSLALMVLPLYAAERRLMRRDR